MPLLSQLEARIDEALVIARASEEGVREVGEMALDAARQARRAAQAAEASARSATQAAKPRAPRPVGPAAGRSALPQVPAPRPRFEHRFRRFNERADAVAARLRELERV